MQLWHSRIINRDNDHNVTYSLFKLSHGKEMYTEILPEHLKKALFQFRIGTYILPVNNRKQLDMRRSERICRICDEGVIGDEIHFLFECPKLEDLRIKYMALGDRMRPNVHYSKELREHLLRTSYLAYHKCYTLIVLHASRGLSKLRNKQ